MGEPKPLLMLLALQGIAVLLLAGWWLLQRPEVRLIRLAQIQRGEQVMSFPPATAQAQAAWLLAHRLARLQGMTGLLVLVVVLGLAEGIARRQRARYGGFLLKSWVLGTLLFPVVVGGVVSYLVLPWPLSQMWYAVGLCGGVGVMAFALASGRPFVP